MLSPFSCVVSCTADKMTYSGDLQANTDLLVQGGFYMSGGNATPSLYYGNLLSKDTRMTLTASTDDWYGPQGGT